MASESFKVKPSKKRGIDHHAPNTTGYEERYVFEVYPNLTERDFRVYQILTAFDFGRDTNLADPTRGTLSNWMSGNSLDARKKKITRAIQSLKEAGAIKVVEKAGQASIYDLDPLNKATFEYAQKDGWFESISVHCHQPIDYERELPSCESIDRFVHTYSLGIPKIVHTLWTDLSRLNIITLENIKDSKNIPEPSSGDVLSRFPDTAMVNWIDEDGNERECLLSELPPLKVSIPTPTPPVKGTSRKTTPTGTPKGKGSAAAAPLTGSKDKAFLASLEFYKALEPERKKQWDDAYYAYMKCWKGIERGEKIPSVANKHFRKVLHALYADDYDVSAEIVIAYWNSIEDKKYAPKDIEKIVDGTQDFMRSFQVSQTQAVDLPQFKMYGATRYELHDGEYYHPDVLKAMREQSQEWVPSDE